MLKQYASVVQWIERQIPVLKVGGSSPFGRAREVLQILYGFGELLFFCPGSARISTQAASSTLISTLTIYIPCHFRVSQSSIQAHTYPVFLLLAAAFASQHGRRCPKKMPESSVPCFLVVF